MQYYLQQNGQPIGPFEMDQLVANGCTPNSMVWREGLPQWVQAKDLEELAGCFAPASAQPQFQPQPQPVPMQPQVVQPQPQFNQQQPYQQQPYGQGYQQYGGGMAPGYAAPGMMPKGEILPVIETIKDGVMIGVKNFGSLIITVILYSLTCWIPYLNVGTTIAMLSIPVELSKGKVINPTFIFDSVYRKYMGRFFIFAGLYMMAMFTALLFLCFPAIVLAYSWYIAIYLLIDKDMHAIKALSKSNEYTYGYKIKIFLIKMAFGAITSVAISILAAIFILPQIEFLAILGILVIIACILLIVPVSLGIDAVIYRELLKREDVTAD